MAELTARGNSTYAEWAPRFWRPPGVERTRSQWRLRLRQPDRWTRLALTGDGELVGLASWHPAREHGDEGARIPGVAYLSHLYVEPTRWRHGIASELLRAAQDAMREGGFDRATLWTPTRAPARAFYERCGWRADGRERWSTELRLPMVGYARDLRSLSGS